MAVGGEAREEVDDEVERAAMASVFDLTDVFELVVDALNERAFAQEQLVGIGKQPLAPILADFGNEMDAVLDQQLKLTRCGGHQYTWG